jgi:hypothetical protein
MDSDQRTTPAAPPRKNFVGCELFLPLLSSTSSTKKKFALVASAISVFGASKKVPININCTYF